MLMEVMEWEFLLRVSINYILILAALSELWRFNLNILSWTHLLVTNTTDAKVNFTVPYPGGLSSYSMAKYNGNIYLFGGRGFDYNTGFSGRMNNMWKFDISDNSMTHLNGSNSINPQSDFDIPYPSGTSQSKMVINNDTAYIFGGRGFSGKS